VQSDECAAPLPLAFFDFDLPDALIAQEPMRPRDHSRLMVLARHNGAVAHHRFYELPELLRAGDVLVVNRTRVVPARLYVTRPSGARAELLFVRPAQGDLSQATQWLAMGRPGKALRVGAEVRAPDGTSLRVEARAGENFIIAAAQPIFELLVTHGETPLPPYIARSEKRASDRTDYQTLFADVPGAVAAPTAGLHFTPEVVLALEQRGVRLVPIVLHVGPGTFLPVRQEHAHDVRGHAMHAEWYEVPAETLAAVAEARRDGRRVLAVGTTSARALETWHQCKEARGESRLFIYPGFRFGVIDGMVTNFHLPRSTLLMLVSALAGREAVLAAYREAISAGYRFFSYGDAMLIV
jgi:S-adenosylmethionine:tRNA ribosyltransferase-isomerase